MAPLPPWNLSLSSASLPELLHHLNRDCCSIISCSASHTSCRCQTASSGEPPRPPLPRSCCTAALEAVQGRRGLLSVSASLCYLLLSHQSRLTLHEFTVTALPSRGHGPRHCPLRGPEDRHSPLAAVRPSRRRSATRTGSALGILHRQRLFVLSCKNTIKLIPPPVKSMSP